MRIIQLLIYLVLIILAVLRVGFHLEIPFFNFIFVGLIFVALILKFKGVNK